MSPQQNAMNRGMPRQISLTSKFRKASGRKNQPMNRVARGGLDRYTVLIGPGYWETRESKVSSVTPSTVACATKILSKGSL